MTIIPAIDIIEGRCVRLEQGDYGRCTGYPDDPVETARRFEQAGLRRLHLVDLDGARSGRVVNLRVLERICSLTALAVDFGGGVRSGDDFRRIFDAGAKYACVGSLAATDPATVSRWLAEYGRDRIIISADVRGERLCTHGWQTTGRMTVTDLVCRYGTTMRWLMCTDIARDGMLSGPATELYAGLARKFPFLDTIASGGVGSIADVAALAGLGLSGAVVGKAIYEGHVELDELLTLNT